MEVALATEDVEAYPVVYRRALMSRLDAEGRSRVWRGHYAEFLSTHPELTDTQRFIVEEAMRLASPAAFQLPLSPELQADIQQVYGESQLFFGSDVAKELFVNLGPEKVMANALPLRQQIADRIRGWRTALADQEGECNCNPDIDTCTVWPQSPWLECSELFSCEFDVEWPMCGPLWSWACTGWCRVVENY
jgi:hypothetical protein